MPVWRMERPVTSSFRASYWSIFSLHNETGLNETSINLKLTDIVIISQYPLSSCRRSSLFLAATLQLLYDLSKTTECDKCRCIRLRGILFWSCSMLLPICDVRKQRLCYWLIWQKWVGSTFSLATVHELLQSGISLTISESFCWCGVLQYRPYTMDFILILYSRGRTGQWWVDTR